MKNFSAHLEEAKRHIFRHFGECPDAFGRRFLGFGGSHTVVTYPPLCAYSQSVDGSVKNILDGLEPEPSEDSELLVDLYLHVPFCEYHCSFCHYSTLVTSKPNASGVRQILLRLVSSAERWQAEFQARGTKVKLRSVYIGGGTGFYPDKIFLQELLDRIFSIFCISSDTNLCVEASASSLLSTDTEEKLLLLRAHGLNRVSVGVQSVDPRVLAAGGRQAVSAGDARKAIDVVRAAGVTSINIDLMQGIDKGYSAESAENDLEWFLSTDASQLTLYIQRLHFGSPEFRKLEALDDLTEEGTASAATRLAADAYLVERGMLPSAGCRYRRSGGEDKYKHSRGSQRGRLLGLGPSAYSRLGSYAFRNMSNVADWRRAVDEGYDALEQILLVPAEERLQGEIISAIREGLPITTLASIYENPEYGLAAFTTQRLEAMRSFGYLIDAGDAFRLTPLGRAFEEEICWNLYSPTMASSVAYYYGQFSHGSRTSAVIVNPGGKLLAY